MVSESYLPLVAFGGFYYFLLLFVIHPLNFFVVIISYNFSHSHTSTCLANLSSEMVWGPLFLYIASPCVMNRSFLYLVFLFLDFLIVHNMISIQFPDLISTIKCNIAMNGCVFVM